MKKSILLIASFIFIIIISCEDEVLSPIQGFTASQGTHIGVIRLHVEEVDGAEAYNIERKNPQSNQWEEIHWGGSFYVDDGGWKLEDNKLQEGQVYEYRARAHRNSGGYYEWSEVATGYLFSPSPKITHVEYSEIDPYDLEMHSYGSCNVNVSVVDNLSDALRNLSRRELIVYRSEDINYVGKENPLIQTVIFQDEIDSEIKVSNYVYKHEPNKNYFYQLKMIYFYEYYSFYDNVLHYRDDEMYIYESSILDGKNISKPIDDDDDDPIEEPIEYNVHNYGEINSSSTGAKDQVVMCADEGTLYLGYFDDYSTIFGVGKPAIMKNSGAGWDDIGGIMPPELVDGEEIKEFDIVASSGVVYLAALGKDTVYVYKNDGFWSENFSSSILLEGSKTGLMDRVDINYLNIALLHDELYLTLQLAETIKVFKYNGIEWEQVGDDIAIGKGDKMKCTKCC